MMVKKKISFRVYEDDWSERQHKDPMSFGMEKWLNDLAEQYDDVEVVGFQHGQSIDVPMTRPSFPGDSNTPYETVYVIAKVIKYV